MSSGSKIKLEFGMLNTRDQHLRKGEGGNRIVWKKISKYSACLAKP